MLPDDTGPDLPSRNPNDAAAPGPHAMTARRPPRRWLTLAFFLTLLVVLLSLVFSLPQKIAGLLVRPLGTATPASTSAQWAEMEHHSLRIPSLAPGAACPVTPGHPQYQWAAVGGGGPAYVVYSANATDSSADGTLFYSTDQQDAPGWGAQKVEWVVATGYVGPVLVRGRQMDGEHTLRFNGGLVQEHDTPGAEPLLDELRLDESTVFPGEQPYAVWGSYTRVQAPGCYAYQVDGLNFQEMIVFRAIPIT